MLKESLFLGGVCYAKLEFVLRHQPKFCSSSWIYVRTNNERSGNFPDSRGYADASPARWR